MRNHHSTAPAELPLLLLRDRARSVLIMKGIMPGGKLWKAENRVIHFQTNILNIYSESCDAHYRVTRFIFNYLNSKIK
jgi:hypothetical protein